MTDTDLRDLFHAAAPDLDQPDPFAIDRAWRDGGRRRVGARAAIVGSIAATAAAVTGVAMLDGSTGRVAPDPSVDSPTSTPTSTGTGTPVAVRAGDYEGAEVWRAPSVTEEASLPPLPDAGLPPLIDLEGAELGAVGEPVVALFSGRGERAFALTASQRVVEIGTSRLDPLTDEAGNGRNPLSPYSLSSDRLSAFFIQKSSLEVLDFATGEWTSIDTPDWLAEGARWVMADKIWVPTVLGEDSSGTVHPVAAGEATTAVVDWVRGWTGPEDEPFGPVAVLRDSTAQAAFTKFFVSGGESYPQALMVDRAGDRTVLTLEYGIGLDATRSKGCCVALGWLDKDTVLFSSSGSEGQRILAWDVGTPSLRRVSDIVGPASITTLVDLD